MASQALRDELAKLQLQVDSLGTGDLADAVSKLQDQVAKVTQSVVEASTSSAAGYDASKVGGRQKITAEDMSAEVVDSNPYSRLMALQRCLLYTSPSPRDATLSRMPSSA